MIQSFKKICTTKKIGVYISYSWNAEKRIPVVEDIGNALIGARLDPRWDTNRITYGASIQTFMDKIGSAGAIVPVLSQAYFESEYCMYELLQVLKHGNFEKRIHPVLLEDISSPQTQTNLVKYWENRTKDLQKKLEDVNLANAVPLQGRLIRYAEISRHVSELLAFVTNMNLLSLKILRDQGFSPLIKRIRQTAHGYRYWPKIVVCIILVVVVVVICLAELRNRQVLKEKRLAVGIGQSLTMLGVDNQGAALPIFDLSLKRLGFPENQRRVLFEEFDKLDEAGHSGRASLSELELGKAQLHNKLEAQWRTLRGEHEFAYIEFGSNLARLVLILEHWEEYPPNTRILAAEEGLNALRRSLAGVRLPKAINEAVRQLQAKDWNDAVRRQGAEQTLNEALDHFDIEPL